jgi:predicted dinucleotide-binding enzyme
MFGGNSLFKGTLMSAQVSAKIGVVGTGKVGAALGVNLAKAGFSVLYLSRTPDSETVQDLCRRTGPSASAASLAEGPGQTDILFFAVVWRAAQETIAAMGDLTGKILLDASNPVIYVNGAETVGRLPSSAGEVIQSWAPGARVVKAFNTLNAKVIANPALSAGPVTIPIAGDDGAAKETARRLIEAIGFEVYDVGPLANSATLESMGKMLISVLLQDRPDAFDYCLRPRAK